jgi:serine/threonine protein kinase
VSSIGEEEEEAVSYLLGPCLGEGGYGSVYLATLQGRRGFSKRVAVKLLHADVGAHRSVLKRFRDEARVLGLLNHPAIVGVHDLVRFGDTWAVVMEYLPGVDLQAVLKERGRVPIRPALEIADKVLGALNYAWGLTLEAGQACVRLEHRDIKPANLLVDAFGTVKVLDFGIARASYGMREAQTQRAGLIGTRPFMAPERWLGESRAGGDQFALATTVLELITGHLPPESESLADFDAWRSEMLRWVASRGSDGVADVLGAALARDPAERPALDGWQRDIRCLLGEMPVRGPDLVSWAEILVPSLMETHERAERAGSLTGHRLSPSHQGSGSDGGKTPAKFKKRGTIAPISRDLEDTGSTWGGRGEGTSVDLEPKRWRWLWAVVGVTTIAAGLWMLDGGVPAASEHGPADVADQEAPMVTPPPADVNEDDVVDAVVTLTPSVLKPVRSVRSEVEPKHVPVRRAPPSVLRGVIRLKGGFEQVVLRPVGGGENVVLSSAGDHRVAVGEYLVLAAFDGQPLGSMDRRVVVPATGYVALSCSGRFGNCR